MSLSTKERQSGFTLVEMLVSVGIAMVILAVIVFNQSTYSDAAGLAQDADNLALVFSEQQAYGVAVKQAGSVTPTFDSAYGVVVSTSDSPTSYIAFIDSDGNSHYTGAWSCGAHPECVQLVSLVRGNTVTSVCPLTSSGVDCGSVTRVDVTFLRPKTTAVLRFYDGSGQGVSVSNLVGAQITIESPRGRTKAVTFYQSGQVSVQ